VSVLDAAEDWKKFPWEIAPQPGPVIWWLRYKIYKREVSSAQREMEEKLRHA